jgi:hypothetical protein
MAEGDDKVRKQALKDAKASLQTETQIANVAERAHKTLLDYSQVKQQIRAIDKEILDLEEKIEKATESEAVVLEQQLATQQLLSKGLKKQLSVVKALGKEMKAGILSSLSQQTQLLTKSVSMFYDIDEAVRKTSMSLGLSSSRMNTLSTNALAVNGHFQAIGLSSTAAIEGQAAFSEEVGRTVMLSQQAMINMGDLAKKTGMSTAEIGGMVGQMEAFGMGSVTAMKSIEEIRDTAQGMGINSGKVIKKVQQNMGLLNKLNFKGGVKGLGKMAAYSEKFKISMEDIASSARAVWSPEGSIEAASSLQTLGGGFSKLADPFKLMFDARNDPQKYAEGIVDSLKGIAKLDGDQFSVSAYEMQRLEEAGKALGFSGEKMKEMAIQKAKMDKIDGSLNMFDDPKDREMLAGMVEFKDGKAIIDGKALSEMSTAEKEKLVESKKTRELNAKAALSAREQWEAIKNQMTSALLPVITKLNEWMEPFIKALSNFIEFLGPTASAISAGILVAVGKLAEWYLKGYRLGIGFNAAVKKGGVASKAAETVKTKVTDMVKSKSGDMYSADSPQGKMIKNMTKKKGDPTSVVDNKVTKPSGDVTEGGGVGDSLKSLAEGLKAMGSMKVLGGALNLIPTSIGMIAMLPSIPTMLFLGKVKLGALYKNLSALGRGLSMMGTPTVLLGAANLILASVGFVALTAGIIGFAMVAGLGWAAGAGLSALSVGLNALGATFPVAGLGILLLLGLGAAMMMMGAAVYFVAAGIELVVDSFTKMFSVVNSDNIMSLLMLGPALLGVSLGIMSLGGSLLYLAATMAMGGWIGLLALGVAAESVGTAFKDIDANGITQSVNAINNVDMDKINALKELSTAMAVWGMFGSKPIEVHMAVDGEIKMGGSDSGTSFDISELSPAQISELKDLVFQKQNIDNTGG